MLILRYIFLLLVANSNKNSKEFKGGYQNGYVLLWIINNAQQQCSNGRKRDDIYGSLVNVIKSKSNMSCALIF